MAERQSAPDTVTDRVTRRREKGTGSLDQLPSGSWRGRVTAPDGKRVTVTAPTETECRRKLRSLAGKVADGAPVASTSHTVRSWLRVWLTEAEATTAPRTSESYASYSRLYLEPHLGSKRLASLRPEHVNAMLRAMAAEGLSPATQLKARAVLRRALTVAVRYGHVTTNVADLTDPPAQREPQRPYLTAEQARQVVRATEDDRLRARWLTALYLGMRQGELLGLRWTDVDLGVGVLQVRQQQQRLTWRHGCGPAPERGKPGACGNVRGASCPERHSGGVTYRQPKGRAGRRTVPLPAPLLAELRAHHRRQKAERLAAGSLWADSGLVFVQPDGKPLNPKTDWAAWRALLSHAGVPVCGTHAARRTAATLLMEAGVDVRIVAEIVGHSSTALTANVYQQADGRMLRHGTDALGELLAGER